MKPFLNKIPRARLYLSNTWLFRCIFSIFLLPIKRGKTTAGTEAAIASYFGVENCYTISSCRMALYYVLKSLNLAKGDEVLLTPLTIPDMVNAIHVLGLKPVFVDMSLEAQNIDVEDLKRKITDKSKALLLTHLSGLVPDMDKIMKAVSEHGLLLIEDVSQGQGATYKSKNLGTFGVAAVATTSISKTISTLWGGFIISQNKDLVETAKRFAEQELRMPSRAFLIKHFIDNVKVNLVTNRWFFSFVTYYLFKALFLINPKKLFSLQEKARSDGKFFENPRLIREEMPKDAMIHFTDAQALVLNYSLRRNSKVTEKRRTLAKIFIGNLSSRARMLLPREIVADHYNTYWHLPVMIPVLREEYQKHLFKGYVDTTGYGLAVCSHEEAFKRYYQNAPVAQFIKDSTIFIPIHDSFTEKQMVHMAQLTNVFMDQHWAQMNEKLSAPKLEGGQALVH